MSLGVTLLAPGISREASVPPSLLLDPGPLRGLLSVLCGAEERPGELTSSPGWPLSELGPLSAGPQFPCLKAMVVLVHLWHSMIWDPKEGIYLHQE